MAINSNKAERTQRWQVVAAKGVGVILALIGILGFLLVTDEGQLFGLFGVNTLHNAVHLMTGIAGLAAGFISAGVLSDEYNKYGGLAYLLIAVLWLAAPALLDRLLNIGLADTLLHFGLAIVLIVVGFEAADRMG